MLYNSKDFLVSIVKKSSRLISIKTISVLALMGISLQACGQPEAKIVPKVDLGSACKKYIGELMGRPVSSMNVDRVEDDGSLVAISYIRSDDQKLFKYECKLDGENIVWRGVDLFAPGEGPGRWRDEDAKSVSTL
jgi:hypothetical protein